MESQNGLHKKRKRSISSYYAIHPKRQKEYRIWRNRFENINKRPKYKYSVIHGYANLGGIPFVMKYK